MSEWGPPQSADTPARPSNGVDDVLLQIEALRNGLRELPSGLLKQAGITVSPEGMTIGSSLVVDGELETTGPATIGGPTTITGDTTIDGELETTGEATIGGPTTISGATTISGVTTITGDTSVTGDLDVSGDLDVTGPLTTSNTASFGGNTTVSGTLTTTGTANVGGTMNVTGDAVFSGDLAVPNGSITNAALANQVTALTDAANSGGTALTLTAGNDYAECTITVPAGFTSASVMGTTSVAIAGTSVVCYVATRIEGANGFAIPIWSPDVAAGSAGHARTFAVTGGQVLNITSRVTSVTGSGTGYFITTATAVFFR